jgi:hypothetical protein
VLKAERAAITESVGEALGIHGDAIVDEVEAMIDQKLAKFRDEMATMLTNQIAMVLTQHAQLKASTDVMIASLRKDMAADDMLLLPNPLRNAKQNGKSNHEKHRPQ